MTTSSLSLHSEEDDVVPTILSSSLYSDRVDVVTTTSSLSICSDGVDVVRSIKHNIQSRVHFSNKDIKHRRKNDNNTQM